MSKAKAEDTPESDDKPTALALLSGAVSDLCELQHGIDLVRGFNPDQFDEDQDAQYALRFLSAALTAKVGDILLQIEKAEKLIQQACAIGERVVGAQAGGA